MTNLGVLVSIVADSTSYGHPILEIGLMSSSSSVNCDMLPDFKLGQESPDFLFRR